MKDEFVVERKGVLMAASMVPRMVEIMVAWTVELMVDSTVALKGNLRIAEWVEPTVLRLVALKDISRVDLTVQGMVE